MYECRTPAPYKFPTFDGGSQALYEVPRPSTTWGPRPGLGTSIRAPTPTPRPPKAPDPGTRFPGHPPLGDPDPDWGPLSGHQPRHRVLPRLPTLIRGSQAIHHLGTPTRIGDLYPGTNPDTASSQGSRPWYEVPKPSTTWGPRPGLGTSIRAPTPTPRPPKAPNPGTRFPSHPPLGDPDPDWGPLSGHQPRHRVLPRLPTLVRGSQAIHHLGTPTRIGDLYPGTNPDTASSQGSQ